MFYIHTYDSQPLFQCRYILCLYIPHRHNTQLEYEMCGIFTDISKKKYLREGLNAYKNLGWWICQHQNTFVGWEREEKAISLIAYYPLLIELIFLLSNPPFVLWNVCSSDFRGRRVIFDLNLFQYYSSFSRFMQPAKFFIPSFIAFQ